MVSNSAPMETSSKSWADMIEEEEEEEERRIAANRTEAGDASSGITEREIPHDDVSGRLSIDVSISEEETSQPSKSWADMVEEDELLNPPSFKPTTPPVTKLRDTSFTRMKQEEDRGQRRIGSSLAWQAINAMAGSSEREQVRSHERHDRQHRQPQRQNKVIPHALVDIDNCRSWRRSEPATDSAKTLRTSNLEDMDTKTANQGIKTTDSETKLEISASELEIAHVQTADSDRKSEELADETKETDVKETGSNAMLEDSVDGPKVIESKTSDSSEARDETSMKDGEEVHSDAKAADTDIKTGDADTTPAGPDDGTNNPDIEMKHPNIKPANSDVNPEDVNVQVKDQTALETDLSNKPKDTAVGRRRAPLRPKIDLKTAVSRHLGVMTFGQLDRTKEADTLIGKPSALANLDQSSKPSFDTGKPNETPFESSTDSRSDSQSAADVDLASAPEERLPTPKEQIEVNQRLKTDTGEATDHTGYQGENEVLTSASIASDTENVAAPANDDHREAIAPGSVRAESDHRADTLTSTYEERVHRSGWDDEFQTTGNTGESSATYAWQQSTSTAEMPHLNSGTSNALPSAAIADSSMHTTTQRPKMDWRKQLQRDRETDDGMAAAAWRQYTTHSGAISNAQAKPDCTATPYVSDRPSSVSTDSGKKSASGADAVERMPSRVPSETVTIENDAGTVLAATENKQSINTASHTEIHSNATNGTALHKLDKKEPEKGNRSDTRDSDDGMAAPAWRQYARSTVHAS
ncbi:hypothetical protein EC973_009089 [Apophysomyces ossiformis]|uniref:Uncharacterized protein n=1 Tax=Apophysomyces ossiformis TaxID=679940 RepID=A0A8H7BMB6_9FUNG|nr:hypothetical protein EC973_009089 [Apophysomyces ossiformis]